MSDLERYIEIWTRYGDGGIEALAEDVTHDVVWEEYRLSPGSQTWHGPDGVRALYQRWEDDFDSFRFEPTGAPTELGPSVVAIPVRVLGRGRGSGVEVDWELFMVTRLRDGRIAHSFFADTLEEARERISA